MKPYAFSRRSNHEPNLTTPRYGIRSPFKARQVRDCGQYYMSPYARYQAYIQRESPYPIPPITLAALWGRQLAGMPGLS